jgi:hypothetical protein
MVFKIVGSAIVALGIAMGGSALAEGQSKTAFCLQKAGQPLKCKYASMAECNKDKAGTDTCIRNPSPATTGSGAQNPAPNSAPKPMNR